LEAWDCLFGKNLTNFGEVSHISNIVTLASCYIGY
jgi:predicted lipase